jgi:hypothetical protein
MKTRSALIFGLLCAIVPGTALAQTRPWIADRAIGEGMGIRTGDFELHPGVAGELGYDSNYFQRSGATPRTKFLFDTPVAAAYRLRITPSLTLATIGQQRKGQDAQGTAKPQFTFRSSLFASYNELFAAGNSEDFSKQRHIDGGANLALEVLPQSSISFDGNGNYERIASPSNDAAITNSWNRDILGLGAGVTWRPGGGMFDWHLGYSMRYTSFEADSFRYQNNFNQQVGSNGRFKFLPRTALIFDNSAAFLHYTNTGALRNSGDILQARVGINGLITNRFSLLAMVGWAATFFEPTAQQVPANYDSVVGQAELNWYLLPQPKLQPGDAAVGLSVIGVGYTRDVSSSYLADYFRRDRVYLKSSYFVGGRFLVDLQGGYSRISHPPFYMRGQSFTSKAEDRVDAQLFTEYRTSDSLGINATLRYDASLTHVQLDFQQSAATKGYTDDLAFSRFQVWLGVRWFM